MSMDTLLTEESSPSRERVTEVLTGHLCRCTGYEPIIDNAGSSRAAGG